MRPDSLLPRAAIGLALQLSLLAGAPALADVVCDRVYTNTVFDDTVAVPDGALCTLNGSRVQGDLKVYSGGSLVTAGGQVRGNIQTDEARSVNLVGTRVGGNVQVKNTFGLPTGLTANPVCGLVINGDLQLEKNRTALDVGCAGGNVVGGNLQIKDSNVSSGAAVAIAVTRNAVAGDLQFTDNDASGRTFVITENRVRKNLQCFDNRPVPTGSGNVAGDVDGQCRNLTAPSTGGSGSGGTGSGGTGSGGGSGGSGSGGGSGGSDEDFNCIGDVARRRFDNVIVPDGATCSLSSSSVKGNIQVSTRGTLIASNVKVDGNIQVAFDGALLAEGVSIGGNIQTSEASWVRVLRSQIRGNVQIDKTSGTPPSRRVNQVCDSSIGGSLQVTKNTAPFELGCDRGNQMRGNLQVVDNEIPGSVGEVAISVRKNGVRGDLQFQNNQTGGVFDITGNRVRQNLQCVDNAPAPTGSGNRAGDLEDQCAGLGR